MKLQIYKNNMLKNLMFNFVGQQEEEDKTYDSYVSVNVIKQSRQITVGQYFQSLEFNYQCIYNVSKSVNYFLLTFIFYFFFVFVSMN